MWILSAMNRKKSAILKFSRCDMEVSMKEEIAIPSPYAELIEEIAYEQNTTVDDIAEKAIRDFLERSKTNA